MNEVSLRILHLNSLLAGGGTDDQCVKLAYALGQLGQDAGIAGPDHRDFSKIVRELAIPFYVTPPEGLAKWRFVLRAARTIRQQRVQIVHGHHGRDLWPTILAARLAGTRPRVVLTRHMAKSPSSWPSRHFLLGQCDALLAVSGFVARVLREGVYEPDSPEEERRIRRPILGDYRKIRVLYGGIDTRRFQPFDATARRAEWGLAPENIAFAVIGGYDLPRGKGQREFLQAAARVAPQVPDARFLIVGRGNMGDMLRADIGRLGLIGRAWLTPYCHDMPAAMNAIDCLVHPQVGTEAFPGVVLEAFACGKPVIASALDGIPEAFATGNYGQLIKPESVDELAAALQVWAARPRASSPERTALHERIDREHSILAFGARMIAFYRELLAGAFPPRGKS